MKIASAAVDLASSHYSASQHQVRESLRAWVGNERPDFEGRGNNRGINNGNNNDNTRPLSGRAASNVLLSAAAQNALQSEKTLQGDAVEETGRSPTAGDPMLDLMREVIRYFTGHDAEVFDARELDPEYAAKAAKDAPARNAGNGNGAPGEDAGPVGWGVEYERHESYSEVESSSFSARGEIRTADGRQINFSVDVQMSRAYHEESHERLLMGDATRKVDPLVLNFSGTAAQLGSRSFRFDLDSDGQTESLAKLGSGSAYLALDRNKDGQINNGSELFGPRTGNGFSELAQLDSDGNQWIDENDPAFNDLRVWDGGNSLQTLQQAGVGALYLGKVDTPFALKDAANQSLGEVRQSGIFLQENGQAGTMQQIDLSV